MKTTRLFKSNQFLLTTAFILIILSMGCRKESKESQTDLPRSNTVNNLSEKSNPFSIRNVERAKVELQKQGIPYGSATSKWGSGTGEEFIYFKFDPANLTTEEFASLENDSTVMLMEIPFGNPTIYHESYGLDESKAEQLKDGKIYGVTAKTNPIITTLSNDSRLQTELLDTLVKMDELDTTLQYQALRQVGFTESEIDNFRICLFKKPHGYVRYWDDQIQAGGRFEPVRRMMVWSLFFGIPVWDYTNDNGYYEIPWRFSLGTIMGTKAKNPRVNIKPFNTVGGFLQVMPQLIANFIVGSVHIEGWVSSCQMRDGKDFNFRGHTQVRLWSQLLNAYSYHDQYCADERIENAPEKMTVYAHWADPNIYDYLGTADFGNASTPMLGHIPGSLGSLTIQYLGSLIGGNDITNYPNLFNILMGLLPDQTYRVPNQEPNYYCPRLAQTAFHELGHASHYRRAGNNYWITLIEEEVQDHSVLGNPYGDGNYENAGYVAVAESWAEFIGTNFAMRRYPNGTMKCTNSNGSLVAGYYYRMDDIIENQDFYYGLRWIPMGLYHDLMDDTNVSPNNPLENWDKIQDITISEIFAIYSPWVTTMCSYYNDFSVLHQNLNAADLFNLFDHHRAACY